MKRKSLHHLQLGIAAFVAAFFLSSLPQFAYATAEVAADVPDWVVFLTTNWVATALLTVAFLAVVVEVFTPTFGIAGFISLVFFALFFVSNFLKGNADGVTILLFVGGVILLIVEVTLEGFGLPGVAGFALVFGGIALSMEDSGHAVISILTACVISVVVSIVFVKLGYKSKLMNRSVLDTTTSKEQGFNSKKDYSYLVGQTGYARTVLRPAGEIGIGEDRYDAMTLGEFIEKGQPVEVYKIENAQIIVRRITE